VLAVARRTITYKLTKICLLSFYFPKKGQWFTKNNDSTFHALQRNQNRLLKFDIGKKNTPYDSREIRNRFLSISKWSTKVLRDTGFPLSIRKPEYQWKAENRCFGEHRGKPVFRWTPENRYFGEHRITGVSVNTGKAVFRWTPENRFRCFHRKPVATPVFLFTGNRYQNRLTEQA